MSVVRGVLVGLAFVVLAAVPARADGGVSVVQTSLNCFGDYDDVVITNSTGAAVTVSITIGTGDGMGNGAPEAHPPVDVPAGQTVPVRVQPLPSIELYSSADLDFWLGQPSGGRLLASLQVRPCPFETDLRAIAVSGVPVTIETGCSPAGGGQPRHGTTGSPTDGGSTAIVYTSNRGYVGPDQFGYACPGASGQSGTVFVTVRPGPARPPPPPKPTQPARPRPQTQPQARPPAQASLPATGVPVGRTAGAGVGLVGVGVVTLLVGRRRRGRAIR